MCGKQCSISFYDISAHGLQPCVDIIIIFLICTFVLFISNTVTYKVCYANGGSAGGNCENELLIIS